MAFRKNENFSDLWAKENTSRRKKTAGVSFGAKGY
jgi:hypothetical protein